MVGNPPYVTGEFIPDDQISYLKRTYQSAVGKFDLYMVFLERALYLRKPAGYVGFIIPNKFMATGSGKRLRGLLAAQPIGEIVDFRDSRVFQGVTNYPCILIIDGQSRPDQFTYRYCIQTPEREVKRVYRLKKDLNDRPWTFSDVEETAILAKIKSGSKGSLGDAVARFSTGIQSGADKILTFTETQIAATQLEREYLRPLLRGRDIEPFHVDWRGKSIFWPYDRDSDAIVTPSEFKSSAPNLFASLSSFRTKLAKRVWFGKDARELSGQWYGLMYREASESFETRHLVVPSLAIRPEFALNAEGLRFVTGTAGVTGVIPRNPSEKNCFLLLGILNSTICAFYMRQTSPAFAGGFLKFTAPYLENVPLPIGFGKGKAYESVQERVWKGARSLTHLAASLRAVKSDTQRKSQLAMFAAAARAVEIAVAELYGLSVEELDLIRAAMVGRSDVAEDLEDMAMAVAEA